MTSPLRAQSVTMDLSDGTGLICRTTGCRNPASGKCERCNEIFCLVHRRRVIGRNADGPFDSVMCDPCAAHARSRTKMWIAITFVILMVISGAGAWATWYQQNHK
jgi:hypothetical protein